MILAHLSDHTGNHTRLVRLDENTPIHRLKTRLITTSTYPLLNRTGDIISYHLSFAGRSLHDSETLKQSGVTIGSVISLVPEMKAAAIRETPSRQEKNQPVESEEGTQWGLSGEISTEWALIERSRLRWDIGSGVWAEENLSGESASRGITRSLNLRIFLSYFSGDSNVVSELCRKLKKESGFDLWLEEEKLRLGENRMRAIRNAIADADVVLIFFSQASNKTGGEHQLQISHMLEARKSLPEDRVYPIPVKLEECEIPDNLRHLYAGAIYEDGGAEKLIYSLLSLLENKIAGKGVRYGSSWKT